MISRFELGGVQMRVLELRMSRRLLSERRLELLHPPGQVVAAALQVAQLPVEFRAVGHELLNPYPQRPVLLRHENILVLQGRPLLLDLLKALLLGHEFRPQRWQLFTYRVQASFVVLEFPLGAIQLRSSIRERGAGFRSSGLSGPNGFLEILDALRQFLVPDGERAVFERQSRVVASRALVRLGQGLELPLRLEVSDFRALDLNQRLLNRRQRIVELGTDNFDLSERELDCVEVRAQTFVAPADRVECARDLERLRRRFATAGMIARRERAQTLDDGTGFG